MKLENCFYLGYVSKIKGYKGEVNIFLDVDFPNDYSEMESVFVVLNDKPIPFFIDRIQITRKGFATVKFEDLDTEDAAKQLVKAGIYLPDAALPKLTGDKFYYHEVQGFTIIDANYGEVGKVNRVLDYSQNPLFEVVQNYKEILIPINDDVVQKVDRETKTIHVTAPEGLIELYLGTSDDKNDDDDF
jgi:16S rRNA processing protein RimM